MITLSNIFRFFIVAALSTCLISCNYLDVVPPEKEDKKDMMIDNATTLKYLYGCYGFINNTDQVSGLPYRTIDGGTDETAQPQEWEGASSKAQYGNITPITINNDGNYPWGTLYNAIGYCNEFIANMEEYNPAIDAAYRSQYLAEVKFLKAYYHFRLMQLYGPIPIIDKFMNMNTTEGNLPGRSHFDYCVNYVVGLLDEAANELPATYSNVDYFGRATSVIALALKARVLTYAASPLWNGSFPTEWSNKNYTTPGYGNELVSRQYDATKWKRAYDAAKEAITAAHKEGFELFDVETSETVRANQKVELPVVPGIDPNTSEGKDFLKKVMMLRYMMTTRVDNGNKENIWGVNLTFSYLQASVPHYVLTSDKNIMHGYWGGLSPTLYTVENFYTKNGIIPQSDPTYTPKGDWFKSANVESTNNVIKLHVNREPRFYAWISFDGDQYSSYIKNQSPLIIYARDPQQQGFNPTLWGNRNYSVTGYLNKKWLAPNYYISKVDGGDNNVAIRYASSLIRLAELYLNYAECCAHLNKNSDALEYVNYIRKRAGVPELSEADVTALGMSILDAVMQERFIELYQEGQRYHDIRRYMKGAQRLSKSCYEGLNAMVVGPSFSEFNKRTPIAQPFSWNDRMYLMPVPQKDVYANPQMVQAPGY